MVSMYKFIVDFVRLFGIFYVNLHAIYKTEQLCFFLIYMPFISFVAFSVLAGTPSTVN